MIKKQKAFTLVELIVVITILAILWTIAFISLQWFSRDARNSARASDMKSIEKVLELYKIKNNSYPIPTNPSNITYSWSKVWTQWTFWANTRSKLWTQGQISEIPKDPLTWSEYTYSILNTNNEYQIAVTFEWDYLWQNNNSILNETYAAWVNGTTYIKWTYNGQVAKTTSWSTTYILAVPSIINWDITLTDVEDIVSNKVLVYNKSSILPASYSWTTNYQETIPTWNIVNNIFIYSTTDNNDFSSWAVQQTIIDNLQTAYAWTEVETDPNIQQIINSDWQSNEIYIVQVIINNYIYSDLEVDASSGWWEWSSFTCWDTVSAWWETYTTALITWNGWYEECWTTQNMRHWDKLASWADMPSNDTTIEKWCYDNTDTNCANEWWLYTWNEAMWYWLTENEDTTKSVCGQLWAWWKLPTDAQYTALTNAWATWWTWNKLNWIVSSLPGLRSTNTSFLIRGTYAHWWTSTEGSDATLSYYRNVNSTDSNVGRNNTNKDLGFSVVCIKN